MASISLISLNIERDLHLDRILPFLSAREPDVVCLQEVCEKDIERIAEVVAADYVFTPTRQLQVGDSRTLGGECIFSRLPIQNPKRIYYVGDAKSLEETVDPPHMDNRAVTSIEVEVDDDVFCIATTHFTWTPQLMPSIAQRTDIESLLGVLNDLGACVLVGDFNAPRGGEIFGRLAEAYIDCIPSEYTMSLDADFHRAGREKLARDAREAGYPGQMVDGLFASKHYRADAVELIGGLSDHKAIVATVTLAI